MGRHKIHAAGGLAPGTEAGRQVLDQIRALESISVVELKAMWVELQGTDPPRHAKRSLLTQVIAWEVQAKVLGGHTASLHRQLLQIGSRSAPGHSDASSAEIPVLRPGVKLIRMWKGVSHHVIVTDTGFFWHERTWRSLSIIAREITGTPWSGPVFFGLRKSKTKAPNAVAAPWVSKEPLPEAPVQLEEACNG